ncbi:uncharacterized protein LOC114244001 [Bombyx mandarina]|uniref:Uncharacterized protein LOC114244001 n=1 Tax=Bombyx mandarina TaxID=7092 RepID=A0A6J2JTC2_BOMMA|nr:uncharacterized protein LOC114244001 [Bombyx mandarina]
MLLIFRCHLEIPESRALKTRSDAMPSDLCRIRPKDKHCLIEYMARNRWSHQIRYVFDWDFQKCVEIRWSAHCPNVPDSPVTNNFPTEQRCKDECSGWA